MRFEESLSELRRQFSDEMAAIEDMLARSIDQRRAPDAPDQPGEAKAEAPAPEVPTP